MSATVLQTAGTILAIAAALLWSKPGREWLEETPLASIQVIEELVPVWTLLFNVWFIVVVARGFLSVMYLTATATATAASRLLVATVLAYVLFLRQTVDLSTLGEEARAFIAQVAATVEKHSATT